MQDETRNRNGDTEVHSKRAAADKTAELEGLVETARGVGDEVVEYVRRRPLAAVGIAAGAGFVVGSVLGTRLGRYVLFIAAGHAVQQVVEHALSDGGVAKAIAGEVVRATRARAPS